MIKVITKQLNFDEELKKKIEFICGFCNVKPIIINDSNITKLEKYCKDKLKVKIYYANDSTNETTIYFVRRSIAISTAIITREIA